ncbi:alanine racemase [Candidatus Riesia pediculischaeffi]|uniref:Alanine racemase n=1 Tax=Candidatus Riesia pediculischaeffi PTSU TaxID=1401651 RepID=A0A0C1V6U3_9ENTR|nr:alanine racemase [Candidatus Riesia pediculischaeffi]KIE64164.1 Alanine racemase [Candidatus Riesia pediculischaeffi PTSU]
MNEKVHMTTALIQRDALLHNIDKIKKLTNNSHIIAIIKSNAYGHGMRDVAKILEDSVDYFGVSNVEEAHTIFLEGVKRPTISLSGFYSHKELNLASRIRLECVVHNHEQVDILEKCQIRSPIRVWMKIDTGMNRLGFSLNRATKIYDRLNECKNIVKPINIMSHFSSANNHEFRFHLFTRFQLNRFKRFIIGKEGRSSIAASSGILFWPSSHLRCVRSGIVMYGISPEIGKEGSDFGLVPAMTLKSRLIFIRQFNFGQKIGYEQSWIIEKKTYIGIVSIGYGDGYHNCHSKESWVFINGRKVPVVGPILMDMIFVDLGEKPHDQIGDEVIIWGKDLPIEKAFNGHEVSCLYRSLSQLTSRVKRRYI